VVPENGLAGRSGTNVFENGRARTNEIVETNQKKFNFYVDPISYFVAKTHFWQFKQDEIKNIERKKEVYNFHTADFSLKI
jgi:hypothetical protein